MTVWAGGKSSRLTSCLEKREHSLAKAQRTRAWVYIPLKKKELQLRAGDLWYLWIQGCQILLLELWDYPVRPEDKPFSLGASWETKYLIVPRLMGTSWAKIWNFCWRGSTGEVAAWNSLCSTQRGDSEARCLHLHHLTCRCSRCAHTFQAPIQPPAKLVLFPFPFLI